MSKKTLENILNLAATEKAERLTIAKDDKSLNCHFVLPGKEEAYFKLPKKLEKSLTNNLYQLLKIAPQELVKGKYCKLKNAKYKLNFRLSILPDKHGEKIIISPLKNESTLFSLNKLGVQRNEKKILQKAITKKSGLILISSPQQQGRSSTLFALLQSINKDQKLTYFMDLYPDFDLSGVIALKNSNDNWERVLKHDSDVIALDSDNINDLKNAFRAASTGRLVLATIEAVNILEALYKVLNLGLPWNMILDNLFLISGQSLANLKRTARKNYRADRKKIAVFEILEKNKQLSKFLKEHQAQVNTKKFWEKFLKIAQKNNYRPQTFDARQKQKDGII